MNYQSFRPPSTTARHTEYVLFKTLGLIRSRALRKLLKPNGRICGRPSWTGTPPATVKRDNRGHATSTRRGHPATGPGVGLAQQLRRPGSGFLHRAHAHAPSVALSCPREPAAGPRTGYCPRRHRIGRRCRRLHRQHPHRRRQPAGQRLQRPPVRRLGRPVGRRPGHPGWARLDTAAGPDGDCSSRAAGLTPLLAHGRRPRRAALDSIREYLCSEAMHGLGIPTHPGAVPSPARRAGAPRRRHGDRRRRRRGWRPASSASAHFEHFSPPPASSMNCARLADLRDRQSTTRSCRSTDKFAGNAYAALLAEHRQRTHRRACSRSGRRSAFATA
jgi:hypothetical protein